MLKPVLAITAMGLGGGAVGLVAYLQYTPRAFTMPSLATAVGTLKHQAEQVEPSQLTTTLQAPPVHVFAQPKKVTQPVTRVPKAPAEPQMQTIMRPCSDWRAISPKYVDHASEQHHVRALCATRVPIGTE